MSKKLLEESTVRSFMKLANLHPLSEEFVKDLYEGDEEVVEEEEKVTEEEEVVEEGEGLKKVASSHSDHKMKPLKEEDDEEEEMPPEEPMGDEMPPEEPGMEEPMGGGGNEELLKNIVNAIANVLGVEVSIDGEGEGEELEMEPEGEPGMEEPMGDEMPPEEPVAQEGMGPGYKTHGGDEEEEEDKSLEETIERISKRVAARLLNKKA